jgi:hypothetical protein
MMGLVSSSTRRLGKSAAPIRVTSSLYDYWTPLPVWLSTATQYSKTLEILLENNFYQAVWLPAS